MDSFLREWWKATLLRTTWSLHWLARMGKSSQCTKGEQKSGWWLDLIILKVSASLGDSMEYELILTCAEQIFKFNRCSQWLGGGFQTADKQWRVLNWFVCLLLLLLIALGKSAFLQFYNFFRFLWCNFILLNWLGITKEAIMLSTFGHTWLI